MAKSPEEVTATMIQNLKETTGKSIDQWLKVVSSYSAGKHGEIVKRLKTDHGIGHGYANLIAHKALESASGGPVDDSQLLEAQYAGAKSGLRPIYDALIKAVSRFGDDVEVSPKKAYVSLRRTRQFALIQPSTSTRVDVGINLKGTPATSRLEESGSFNAMVSHRVRISSVKEVDSELIGWLQKAYASS